MENTLETTKIQFNFRLYKKLIFKILTGLKGCQLIITDNGEQFVFGDGKEKLTATIQVNNPKMYSSLLFGGSIGIAESYINDEWDTDDLTKVIQVFARNLALLEKFEKRFTWLSYPSHLIQHWLNRNTKKKSKANILAHYDISNELYERMLDPNMQYSSAIFSDEQQSLNDAQENKLKTICDSLELSENDHLLEIGTGWGGLACYAAQHYGCQVTTTTISDAQHKYAKQRITKLNLDDKITLLKQDYRDLTGKYDKVVSIEMIEAVGHQFLPGYFKKINSLLKDNGTMLIQAITIKDQQYDSYRKGVDFIQRYIFPGGCLPSINEIAKHITQKTDMCMVDLKDFGLDYAKTIDYWHHSFDDALKQIKDPNLDHKFKRLWHFYFGYCRGGFLEGNTSVIHVKANKPRAKQ